MEFRKAVKADADSILSIIRQAQDYLKEQGIDQWQNHYPNMETVMNDISNGNGYVLVMDQMIVGTAVVIFDGEKTYGAIYNGNWISNDRYAVIHRIAIESDHKGLGLSAFILRNVEEMCLKLGVHSIRLDTHKDNSSMQKMLLKNGFQYCGIIYLADNIERIAFEKLLQVVVEGASI